MKKTLSIALFLFLSSFLGTSSATEVTMFGPKQYVRTTGSPDVYTDSFTAIAGEAQLIVKNGNWDGSHRITDAISSASVAVNGVEIFGPNDFNQQVYQLEALINVAESNSILVELASNPDSYITIEVIQDVPPPTVTISAVPEAIHINETSTLSWTSTGADSASIDQGIGDVDVSGSTTVSPTETMTYTITVTNLGGTGTASVTVTMLNTAPVADPQQVATDEDTAVLITLTGSDVDGDPLTYQVTSPPANGTLMGTAPALTYTPGADWYGTDTFTFTVNDGTVDSAPATVTITVNPVNDPPVAVDDTATTDEDTAVTTGNVLANDTDVEGDILSVSGFTAPANGTAVDNGDGTFTYTPNPDFNGTDSFTYMTDDGNGGSATATVTVTVTPVNDAPVANAGSDQTVFRGDPVVLDGSGSSDVDVDPLTYQWAFSSVPAGSTATLSDSTLVNPAFVPDVSGTYEVQLIVNDGTVDSLADTVVITANPRIVQVPDVVGVLQAEAEALITAADLVVGTVTTAHSPTVPVDHVISQDPTAGASVEEYSLVDLVVSLGAAMPTATISADPASILAGQSSMLTWSSTDADSCIIEPGIGTVDLSGSMSVTPTETTGYIITATGPGGTATASVTVTVTPVAPTVSMSANPGAIGVGGTSTLSWDSTDAQSAYIDNDIGVVPVSGTTTVSPEHTTRYTITVTGPIGSASAQAVVMVLGSPQPQPENWFGEQYEDLIPPDATVTSYDPKRFSVITGLVQDLADLPIADVSVTILDHPEYGTAMTDSNGRFSIPVEGGATTTVVYQKAGLLTVHRKVYVPWNDIAIAKTIRMIGQDPASTTVTFDGNPETVVTHQSTEVTDEFGTRSCTMVFTGDNHAYQVDAQGNVIHELTTITTRATEYTTPDSMPAILPPTSAYTYCLELSVDGVERVKFDKPVITWADNFLGFDVGIAVPVGTYDRDKGVWVPEKNGVVVKLLDTDTDGVVDALDADGDDQPDDLNSNGSFSDEVRGLNDPLRYQPESTFWRVEVTHFTIPDWNWAFWLPPGAIPPTFQTHTDEQKNEGTDCHSSVEKRSRIFHEDIPIPGTDMTLHYASNRVPGYGHKITVPVSMATVPSSLKRIIVKVAVAGRTFEQVLDPLPNQKAEFIWNRLDHRGRPVIGRSVYAHISVGFVYEAFYYVVWVDSQAAVFPRSFARPGVDVTPIPTREEVIWWRHRNLLLRTGGARGDIAEGWTLSHQHYLSPTDPTTLHKGDGTINTNYAGSIITTMAGKCEGSSSGDGGPAILAALDYPRGLAVDAAGNLYIAEEYADRIRKVDTNGIITTVAGIKYSSDYGPSYSGDGGPATEAKLNSPLDVAVDAAGNLYIADTGNKRVRKVDTSGFITTVAGNGTGYGPLQNAPAIEAAVKSPKGVAVDAAGNLYIVGGDWDYNHNFIRKVDTSGFITIVAGTGGAGYTGDGGPATQAQLRRPLGVAVDAAGNMYIADTNNNRIRKVDTSGIITTVAGDGTLGNSGDGGPATEAQLYYPADVAVDAAGNLYIAHEYNSIRKVDTNGIITTVAGTGTRGYWGDGGPATQAWLWDPTNVVLDAAGSLYITDKYCRIRKVAPPSVFAEAVISGNTPFTEESGLGYIMSSAGRHKKTIDLSTGTALRVFGYDEATKLVSITDRFGNEITIDRDAGGVPTAITSPDGITTHLTIDANNRLTRITYPDGGFYSFEYTADGLMTAKIEPEGNRFEHVFDSLGRLTDATDEEGGHWQFFTYTYWNDDTLARVTTGEGNLTSYLDHTDLFGAYTSTITGPTGSQTLFTKSADGLTVNKSLPCGMELAFNYAFDSEYKYKYVNEMRESTPSALEKVTLRTKTYQDTNADQVTDRITERVTVNGKVTKLVTDTLQSTKTLTSPRGRTVTTHYDPNNLLTTSLTVPGLSATNYAYDTKGRLTSILTDVRQTTFSYDAQGNLASITDPENHTTTYSYDAVGRMTGINRPDGSSVGFTYDNNGNMTVLTNPATINHGFGYNSVNLNTSYQTPLSGSYSYVYDKDRRLVQTNFPSGNQINNVYSTGRLQQIQTPEGNIDLTYLCGTKVDSISKGTESITYGYDGSLITSETLSGTLNQTLSYGYNNDFNLNSFTYAGETTGYTHENDGLLIGAGNFTITRNAGNGLPVTVTDGAYSLNHTFNGYGELEGQDFAVNSSSLTDWSLTRDDNGRITGKAETVDGVTSNYSYTYDPMGRLLTVTKDGDLAEEYQYGPNGTRTYEMNDLRGISGRTFAYSDEDHLLSVDGTTYEYDADGFLTTKTEGTDVTTYDYSSRGELLGVTLPDGTTIDYVHDPIGRRIAKKVNGSITEKYLWQGLTRLLAVYDGSDNLVMRFEYADGRMPVAMTKDGSTYYLAYDQVGSVRAVADASGGVVKKIEYDSFGNIIDDTNPLFEIPFGFAGGLHDRDASLVRFGFRDYDPDVGRWTAKDPMLFAGGDVDLYGYCLSDPINAIDPLGLLNLEEAYAKFESALKPYVVGGALVVTGGVTTVAGAITAYTGFTSTPATGPAGVLVGTTGLVVTGVGVTTFTLGLDVYADELRRRLGFPEWFDIMRNFEFFEEGDVPCK